MFGSSGNNGGFGVQQNSVFGSIASSSTGGVGAQNKGVFGTRLFSTGGSNSASIFGQTANNKGGTSAGNIFGQPANNHIPSAFFTFTHAGSEPVEEKTFSEADPGAYTFSHTELHDCEFIVGGNSDVTETITAPSCQLEAQSTVIKELLKDSKKGICVRNVSPNVFRLLLTFLYGGKLQNLDQETAAQLAIAADHFNISPLVAKACEQIELNSAEDVFPAWWCVAYNVNRNEFETRVAEILQEETQTVLNSRQFLDLDTKCLQYFLDLKNLSVTDVGLWRALVCWGEHKANKEPNRTLRQHLQPLVQHLQLVRLSAFSLEEIVNEVILKDILAPEEVLKLLTAAANNKTSEFSALFEEKVYNDAAEYIFGHVEYHDCDFIVGRHCDKAEQISAVSGHLLAHSTVFRELLRVQTTEIRIRNVSPDVFKLLLTFVYRGKLPLLDQGTAAQLAVAADRYKIPSLMDKAREQIKLSGVEDVFPALWCVAYDIPVPEMIHQVLKIVQQQTQAVLSSEQFLDLDAKCLEYVSRQETLSVSELELWRAVVRWGKHKVSTDPDKTLRQHLRPILQHIRVYTLSLQDIINEFILPGILTRKEGMRVLEAVSNRRPLHVDGICNIRDTRQSPDVISVKTEPI